MRRLRGLSAVLVCVGIIGAAVFCGCEDGPDMNGVGDEFNGTTGVGTDHGDTLPAQFSVSPASVTVTNNGAVAYFRVVGASGGVRWSVHDISKGSILTQSATAATYQRASAGDNVVIATDGSGAAAFATVS